MKKTYLADDIIIYEDFVSEEDCKRMIMVFDYLDKTREDYWKSISFYESYSSAYPEDGNPYLTEIGLTPTWFTDLENRFKEAAADLAKTDISNMSKISFHSQRWVPGAFAPYHSDNSDEDGNMGAFTRSRYAGFLYLNDDFEGGELVFKGEDGNDGLTIKPKTGMFAIFHGGHKNMHRVEIVKKSTRYTFGSFWDDREESDYPEEEKKRWAEELAETRAMQKEQSKEW